MATSQYIIIPLTRGYSTIVDEIDSDLANYRWHVSKNKNNDRNIYASRMVHNGENTSPLCCIV